MSPKMPLNQALIGALTLHLNNVMFKPMRPNTLILMIAKTAPKRTFSAIFYAGAQPVVLQEMWPVGLMT